MPPVGFETTISAGEPPQTYALDCAATGNGKIVPYWINFDLFLHLYLELTKGFLRVLLLTQNCVWFLYYYSSVLI